MAEPARWRISIGRAAKRTFRRLPKPLLTRLLAEIDTLSTNPRPSGSLKLAGFDDLWRIRSGDWRIVYAIQDEQLLIVVVEVEPRGSAYRHL